MPDWVPVFLAAEKLGCPPWELVDMPAFWTVCALTLSAARNKAEQAEHERAQRDAKRQANVPPGYVAIDDIDQLRAMGLVAE